MLKGLVVDSHSGQPVPNVTIELTAMKPANVQSMRGVEVGITDSDGIIDSRFTLPWPAADCRIELRADRHAPWSTVLRNEQAGLTIDIGRVELDRGTSVSGSIGETASGAPLARVVVYLLSATGESTKSLPSDSRGQFRFDRPVDEGRYALRAAHDGAWLGSVEPTSIVIEGDQSILDVRAPSLDYLVEGRAVFTEDGEGAPGVTVRVGDDLAGTVTDADGTFKIHGNADWPDSALVRVESDDFAQLATDLTWADLLLGYREIELRPTPITWFAFTDSQTGAILQGCQATIPFGPLSQGLLNVEAKAVSWLSNRGDPTLQGARLPQGPTLLCIIAAGYTSKYVILPESSERPSSYRVEMQSHHLVDVALRTARTGDLQGGSIELLKPMVASETTSLPQRVVRQGGIVALAAESRSDLEAYAQHTHVACGRTPLEEMAEGKINVYAPSVPGLFLRVVGRNGQEDVVPLPLESVASGRASISVFQSAIEGLVGPTDWLREAQTSSLDGSNEDVQVIVQSEDLVTAPGPNEVSHAVDDRGIFRIGSLRAAEGSIWVAWRCVVSRAVTGSFRARPDASLGPRKLRLDMAAHKPGDVHLNIRSEGEVEIRATASGSNLRGSVRTSVDTPWRGTWRLPGGEYRIEARVKRAGSWTTIRDQLTVLPGTRNTDVSWNGLKR